MMRGPSTRVPSSTSSNSTPCSSEELGLKRGPWTPEEDELLANYIHREGEGRWRTLPKRAGLRRCGKSCRLRWMNYLRPCLKHGQITPDEEDLILRLHRLLGNRWSLIAGRIPGRTDNEIKNYWNTHMSKKLISQGLDPRTHKPLVSLSHPDHSHATTTPTTTNNDPHDHDEDLAKDAAATASLSELIQHQLHEPHKPSAVCITKPSDDHNTWHIPVVNKDQKGYLDQYENNGDGNLEVLFDGDESGALTTGNISNDMEHLIGSDIGGILHVDDEDHLSYNSCYDDVFSSFLNSLTEEDSFFQHTPTR